MTRFVLRAGCVSVGAGLPMAAALSVAVSLGGCASPDGQPGYAGYQVRPLAAHVETSSVRDPAVAVAAPGPKVRGALEKTGGTSVAAPRPVRPAVLTPGETGCASVDQCRSVLKAMVEDPDRSWMRHPAKPVTLANGVRLFAYRALRPKLTCSELAIAVQELAVAAVTFSVPVPGLQPDQVSRTRALSGEVEGELQAERARRCGPRKDDRLEQSPEDRQETARTTGADQPANVGPREIR